MYVNYIIEVQLIQYNYSKQKEIDMGGAGGHMAHLHENTWLTFGDIKSFLTQVATAEISPIEKVDGQNIHFRWTPQGVMCARNDGHIKKGGIPESEYRAMWKGHPAEDAFIKGFEKIKSAVESLSPEGQDAFKTTQPGTYRFCNCEIMYPENENLILYDGNYVVIHNLKELSIVSGKVEQTDIFMIGSPEFDAIVQSLEDSIKSEDAQEWQLFGPKYVQLKKLEDGTVLQNAFMEIDGLGYQDDQKVFSMVLKKYNNEYGIGLPKANSDMLLQRIKLISEGAKTKDLPDLRSIKSGLNKDQKALVTEIGSVSKAKKFIGTAVAPLALAISDYAIEILRGLESFFVADTGAEVKRLRNVLNSSVEALQSYEGDNAEKIGDMLERQLEKLGSVENIASSLEGIIFEYPPGSQNLVKLTGSFAMANQIIGRAKRLPAPALQANEIVDMTESKYNFREMEMLYEAIGMQDFDSVAVIPGAFKPPHIGHVGMVDHYLRLADKVIVYISDPKSAKSQRTIAGKTVTADMSKAMWEILLAGKPNVEVKISPSPSPVSIAYDSVMPANPEKNYEGTPYEPGTTVYLGSSVKGNDSKRFSYALSKASPDLIVPDPVANAAPAIEHDTQYMHDLMNSKYAKTMPSVLNPKKNPIDFHASDFRYILEQAVTDPEAKIIAAHFVGGMTKLDQFMAVLGLKSLSESYKHRYSLLRHMFGE